MNILNINENQLINKPKEISLTFNSGKIVLSDSDEGSRLYIYSYGEKKESLCKWRNNMGYCIAMFTRIRIFTFATNNT